MEEYTLTPNPDKTGLCVEVDGIDNEGNDARIWVVNEQPLTLYLNGQEILTMMTIGDHLDLLAVGYLLNQNMLLEDDEITAIEHDEDIQTIVVRTKRKTDYEEKLKKKTQTSGCAQGTVFGDIMDKFDTIQFLDNVSVKTSWLYQLQNKINRAPSIYLKAGAIHGCVLCQDNKPLIYVEDVGRHNAVDKIAGYMFLNKIKSDDKMFYTTGRLTSEMVIKTAKMGIPVLLSRSGFTAWGVELANQVGMTLIGRMRGRRFTILAGTRRVEFDLEQNNIDGNENE